MTYPTKVNMNMNNKDSLENQENQAPPADPFFGGPDDDIWGDFPMTTTTQSAPAPSEPAPKGAFKPKWKRTPETAKAPDKEEKDSEEKGTYVDLDSEGLPYDERIHATPKKKNPSNGPRPTPSSRTTVV